jgi:hypothetical protein
MLGDGFLPLGFELFGGAEAAIGFAFAEQLSGVLAVNCQPLRLAVGCMRAFNAFACKPGTFVPVQAEPLQIFDQLRFVARFAAVEIGIFNAEQEISAGVPGKEPVVERCPGIAHMQQSRRRGRESNARFLCVHT